MNAYTIPSFYGSREIYDRLVRLLANTPNMSLVEYGLSDMKKPLLVAGLGSGSRKVLFTAAHHANEWLTSLVLMRFLEEFTMRQDWQYLLADNSLSFVPLVNPDAVDLVVGTIPPGPSYEHAVQIALDYPEIPFPDGWKANIQGVDLNLQYPAGWEKARELKFAAGFTSPAPRDYVGEYPFEASESSTLAGLTNILDPDLIIALHSQGEVIFYMYQGYYPPGTFPLVQQMADVSGYELASVPSYSDNAGYKDWFIDKFDRPGFTIEMGLGENPLPITDLDSIYRDVAPMLLLAAGAAY